MRTMAPAACEVTRPLPVSTRRSLFDPIADDAAHDDEDDDGDDAETAFGESCTCAIIIAIPIIFFLHLYKMLIIKTVHFNITISHFVNLCGVHTMK